MVQVYCAGPLFNDAERSEMAEIARILERSGYSTFLPQRDGLEFVLLRPELETLGAAARTADAALQRAIFSLDVYQLLSCSDAVVGNLNGRVPDEGTVVEVSLAWHAGKALVLYKKDARTILSGSDNPMLTGLGEFSVVDDISKLPKAVELALAASRGERVSRTLRAGEEIAKTRSTTRNRTEMAKLLLREFVASEGGP